MILQFVVIKKFQTEEVMVLSIRKCEIRDRHSATDLTVYSIQYDCEGRGSNFSQSLGYILVNRRSPQMLITTKTNCCNFLTH